MRLIFFVLLTAFSLSSCRFFGGERVYGDGKITTQQRNVAGFTGIDVAGAMNVQVVQGAAHSVKIEGDQNLLSYIHTELDNGLLHIYTEKGINPQPSKEIIVYVTAPFFTDINVSGASNITGKSPITGDKNLEIEASGASSVEMEVNLAEVNGDISGASTLKLRGRAAHFVLEASGACHAECMDLVTDESTLDISGASDVKITSNKQLNIEASGASNVEYKGNAAIDQKSSGASSVKKVG